MHTKLGFMQLSQWPFSMDFMCEGLILEVIQGLTQMQISLNLHLQSKVRPLVMVSLVVVIHDGMRLTIYVDIFKNLNQ